MNAKPDKTLWTRLRRKARAWADRAEAGRSAAYQMHVAWRRFARPRERAALRGARPHGMPRVAPHWPGPMKHLPH